MVTHIADKVARRIILGKDALSEARTLVNQSDLEFNLMKGIWLCDFAMEAYTPALCEHLGIIIPTSKDAKRADPRMPALDEYLALIEEYFSASLSDTQMVGRISYLTARAKKIHQKRNQVQHEGISFSSTDTRSWVTEVASYLDELSIHSFGMGIDSITASIMIKDDEARYCFEGAHQKFDVGEFEEAAYLIAKGYNIGVFNAVYMSSDFQKRDSEIVKKRTEINFSSLITEQLSTVHVRTGSNADIEARRAIERLIRYLSPMQFGMTLNKSVKFLALMPKVERTLMSSEWFVFGESRQYTKEEIQFLIDTAIESVYHAESYFL
jgi:hypothetical protein